MAGRHLVPALKRHRPKREPKRRFIIFCEGKKTEPAYFAALRNECAGAQIEVETIPGVGVPHTVAKSAAERARELALRRRQAPNSFEENDQVWAVFNRDLTPHFEEAVGLCERNRIGVGRSNPCFEAWLILHVEDFKLNSAVNCAAVGK